MPADRPVAALAFALALAGPGAAQAAPEIGVQVMGCGGVDPAAVARLVGIELRARVTARPTVATSVEVTCQGGLARVQVDDRATGKSTTSSFDLQRSAPVAKSRVLALAIAELVSWSWAELVAAPPSQARQSASASEDARDRVAQAARETAAGQAVRGGAAPPGEAPLRLGALAQGRALAGAGPLYGLGARLSWERGRLGAGLDAVGELGTDALPSVAVDVRAVSGGASAWWRAGTGAVALRAGGGLRVGRAWLAGTPSDARLAPGGVAGPWGGPFLLGAVGTAGPGPVALELRAEAGWTLLRVEGGIEGTSQRLALRGPWGVLQMAVGF